MPQKLNGNKIDVYSQVLLKVKNYLWNIFNVSSRFQHLQ